jgi:hypothetical protein
MGVVSICGDAGAGVVAVGAFITGFFCILPGVSCELAQVSDDPTALTSRLTNATNEAIINGRKKLFVAIFDPPIQRVMRQESYIGTPHCRVTKISLWAMALGRALPCWSKVVITDGS